MNILIDYLASNIGGGKIEVGKYIDIIKEALNEN